MNLFTRLVSWLFSACLLLSCKQVDPELQRKAVFDICACMDTKDALLVRDTLAMHHDIRMLHYTQCIFDFGNEIDPFDPSFRSVLEINCTNLIPLHDAFVEAGTKKEKAVN